MGLLPDLQRRRISPYMREPGPSWEGRVSATFRSAKHVPVSKPSVKNPRRLLHSPYDRRHRHTPSTSTAADRQPFSESHSCASNTFVLLIRRFISLRTASLGPSLFCRRYLVTKGRSHIPCQCGGSPPLSAVSLHETHAHFFYLQPTRNIPESPSILATTPTVPPWPTIPEAIPTHSRTRISYNV